MLAGAMVGCYPHLMCQVLRSRFAAVCVRRLRPRGSCGAASCVCAMRGVGCSMANGGLRMRVAGPRGSCGAASCVCLMREAGRGAGGIWVGCAVTVPGRCGTAGPCCSMELHEVVNAAAPAAVEALRGRR